MKKTLFRFSALFLAILVLFVGFPFNSLSRVKASTNPANNFIDFLRTNLGIAKVDNGSLSALDRTDFVLSLYNTSLAWQDNDITFSFVPADVFTKNEWVALATSGTIPSPNFAQYDGFDLKQSLIMSDYIHDTGSGYDLSNMPKLENIADTLSPLDGVEVKTNFSDYNAEFSNLLRPQVVDSFYSSLSNDYLNLSDKLIIVKFNYDSKHIYYYFISPKSDVIFSSFYFAYNFLYFNYYTSDLVWHQTILFPCLQVSTSNDTNIYDNYLYPASSSDSQYFNYISTPSFNHNNIKVSSLNVNMGRANDISSFSFYSTFPIVIGSDFTSIRNYYNWLSGVPSGSFYTTANTNTVYSYDYVTNNNWETAYNNYITDVSNYYSTTENITNEQLTKYIDNSTTITNITNNYIDNSGSGGGGDSPESGLIVSWLEKIFDRVTDIYNTILGKDSDGDIIYNDNSIRYSIIEYPLSDLFPSVPQSSFIPYSDVFDFGIAQNHLNNIMRQIIPFCYLYQLQTIATALEAPPQTPHYEIPFTIERLNIDEEIVINLSAPAWNTLHSIWITLFTIMLITALLYATYKFLILLNSIFG